MANIEIEKLDASGLRKFALTMAVTIIIVFGIVVPYVFDLRWPVWPWILAAIFTLWGLVAPSTLDKVYVLWMKFGLLLNKFTSPIVLGVLFFGVIMPFGLIRRIRFDPLHRTLQKNSPTYRSESNQPDRKHLENPY